MKTFSIIYQENEVTETFKATAINRGVARAQFKQLHPEAKILTISMGLTTEQKMIQEAAVENTLKFGVQKSLQLGYKDLPLFQEEKQLKLF